MIEIYKALRKFFDVNKVGARNIYLGTETFYRVSEQAGENFNANTIASTRRTILGLNVYIVDADEHFALS